MSELSSWHIWRLLNFVMKCRMTSSLINALSLNLNIAMADRMKIVLVLVAFYLIRRAIGKARSRGLRNLPMFFFWADKVDHLDCVICTLCLFQHQRTVSCGFLHVSTLVWDSGITWWSFRKLWWWMKAWYSWLIGHFHFSYQIFSAEG